MGSYIGTSHNIRKTLAILNATRAAGKVAILWGPPGVGKTALVRALAKKHNVPLYILIPSTMDPTDIAGLPALKKITTVRPDGTEDTVNVTDQTLVWWAEEVIRTGEGIIFFDEASTATPAVQASLLSVLQGRTIGRHTIPDTVWMIAAANEAEDAADGWELAPPMANRFTHIDYKPDLEDFFNGMIVNWLEPMTEEQRQVRLLCTAFLRANTSLANKMPSEANLAGKAWPSFRSWDNLADIIAALNSDEDLKNDPELLHAARKDVIRGTVGDAAAQAFFMFEDSLRITPVETILADPRAEKGTWDGWQSMDVSSLFITFENALNGLTVENADKSADLFIAGHDLSRHRDIAASFALRIIEDFGTADTDSMLKVLEVYQDFITRAAAEVR